jgi:hypothetical protein
VSSEQSKTGYLCLNFAHCYLLFANLFRGFFMKNTIKTFGIIVLVAIIGVSFITCDDGGDNNGGGGGGGKVPAELIGNWLADDQYVGQRYLVFDKDGWGQEASFAAVKIGWIVTSVAGSKIDFQHKDFGKEFAGSFEYSITGTKLTLSNSSGGSAIQSAEGTYTKQ